MNWFTDALKRHGATQGGGLGPLIPALAEWFTKPEFRGCAFINSVAELGEFKDVVAISRRHKADMCKVLAELLPRSRTRPVPADELTVAVAIAVDGAIFKAQLESTKKARLKTLEGLALILDALQSS